MVSLKLHFLPKLYIENRIDLKPDLDLSFLREGKLHFQVLLFDVDLAAANITAVQIVVVSLTEYLIRSCSTRFLRDRRHLHRHFHPELR